MNKQQKKLTLIGIIIFLLVIIGFIALQIFPTSNSKLSLQTQRELADKNSALKDFNTITKSLKEWQKINKDTRFIMEVNNTQFPIVQASDLDEYVHHNIYKKYDFYGTPFIDPLKSYPESKNLVIYAHSSGKENIGFSFLKKFNSSKNWIFKDEDYLTIHREDGGYEKYKPYAFFLLHQDEVQNHYLGWKEEITNEQEFRDFTKSIMKVGVPNNQRARFVQTIADCPKDCFLGKFVTLVTCKIYGVENSDQWRYVMMYRLIESSETKQ